jgi:diaminopimelate decarboxylase
MIGSWPDRKVHINANCLEELDRVEEILRRKFSESTGAYEGTVGLRINPLVGAGTIEELSVSTVTSKFGVRTCGMTIYM